MKTIAVVGLRAFEVAALGREYGKYSQIVDGGSISDGSNASANALRAARNADVVLLHRRFSRYVQFHCPVIAITGVSSARRELRDLIPGEAAA